MGPFLLLSKIKAEIAILSRILTPKKIKKEDFNRHQSFSTNKQYIKIKLMQNETNCLSISLVKTKY